MWWRSTPRPSSLQSSCSRYSRLLLQLQLWLGNKFMDQWSSKTRNIYYFYGFFYVLRVDISLKNNVFFKGCIRLFGFQVFIFFLSESAADGWIAQVTLISFLFVVHFYLWLNSAGQVSLGSISLERPLQHYKGLEDYKPPFRHALKFSEDFSLCFLLHWIMEIY